LDVFPYIEQDASIAEMESQPLPHPMTGMETHPSAGTPLSDYISQPWEHNTQDCLETNLHNNSYYPFVTCELYKHIQCGTKQKGMDMYHDNMLQEENSTLRLPSFQHGDAEHNPMDSMPDDQPLGEWELHALEDMRWNDSHQHPIKYWSRDIIN
jgi:hypothetical protein